MHRYIFFMGIIELLIIAVGLSMDAFAVSVCKGLATSRVSWRHMLCVGCWFGGFQALMPCIGWLLGSRFRNFIESVDHWIAFLLLAFIGINMIREALSEADDNSQANDSFSPKTMLPLAVATSIDALAVGITFGLLLSTVRGIVTASLFICSVTFTCSAIGIKIGAAFGSHSQKKAEITGGIILIAIGIKILLEHLELIKW